jgi:nucleotide-binding universal stress UspA family protein
MTYIPIDRVPFRRVLVGWDCSPGSAAALRAVVAIADMEAGHVVALAVLRPAPYTENKEEGPADLAERQHHAFATFSATKKTLDGPCGRSVSLHFVESADAARAVREYAIKLGFDLLVLGRHGAGGLLHPKLGHVARAATRDSRLTVLLAA